MASATDTLQILPDATELQRMRQFVREQGRDSGLSEAEIFSASLVATEAVTNAIKHGTHEGGDELIEIKAGRGDDGFCIEVGDRGTFVPRVQAAPDDVGGRGLGLMRRLTRRFDMETGSDGTHLSMLLGGASLDELAA
jgi:anti-sigma regulatory factor (Ser/Thr protein kinase)